MIKSIKRLFLVLFALAVIQFGIFSSVRAVGPCEQMQNDCLATALETLFNSDGSNLANDQFWAFAKEGGYCDKTYSGCENPPN